MTHTPPNQPGPAARNLTWHHGLSRAERFAAMNCRGSTLWFTGFSASGKSTIAAALERALVERGVWAYRLDGDNIRMGLNKNLGFSADDRAENIRRVAEVARLFADAGCVAIASFISPYRADRDAARALHEHEPGGVGGESPSQERIGFLEVFVDTPIEVCEARDPKGLYKKARAGDIKGFTGIDDPYEPPATPEIHLTTATMSVEQCVQRCIEVLAQRGIVNK